MSVTSVAILCRSWVRSVLLPVLVVAFCGACTVGPLGPQSESFATPDHTVKPAGPPLPLPSPTEPPATPVPPTVALPTMTAMPPTATASVPSPTARPATATVPPAPSPPPPTPTVPPPPPTQPPPPTRPAPTATVPLPTATPEPAPTLVRPVRPAPGRYGLAAVASGFRRPLYLTAAPGDTAGRLFVVEQDGTIITVRDGRRQEPPFLDIRDRVHARANEQGLLSMAFDPDFAANGTFYVYYTDSRGATVVARYRLAPDNPAVADPGSEEIILRVDQPFSNHNGGLVLFGPDGYLYVGLGDGGSGGDPQGHGQDPRTLLGTILRVDVRRSSTYVVPPDNPFVGQSDRRSEIWAYGLRNPWRFSFDRLTGDLYIADVGQNAWEEVSFQRGEQQGWRELRLEGVRGLGAVPRPAARGADAADQRVRPSGRLLGDRRLRLPGPAATRARRQLPLWRLLHRVRLGADTAGRWRMGPYPAVRLQRPNHLLRRGCQRRGVRRGPSGYDLPCHGSGIG